MLRARDRYDSYLEIMLLTPIMFLCCQGRIVHNSSLGGCFGADFQPRCWIVTLLQTPALTLLEECEDTLAFLNAT